MSITRDFGANNKGRYLLHKDNQQRSIYQEFMSTKPGFCYRDEELVNLGYWAKGIDTILQTHNCAKNSWVKVTTYSVSLN